jgi:elongation factor G
MFGYSTIMRSLSKGRASFSMEPERFDEVPSNVVNQILETSTRGRY